MEKMTGLYETKLISEGLQAAWFKDKKSLGVEFSTYFDPITLVTIALILMAVRCCRCYNYITNGLTYS